MPELRWDDPAFVAEYLKEHPLPGSYCARGQSGDLCLKPLVLKDDGLLYCPKHGLEFYVA